MYLVCAQMMGEKHPSVLLETEGEVRALFRRSKFVEQMDSWNTEWLHAWRVTNNDRFLSEENHEFLSSVFTDWMSFGSAPEYFLVYELEPQIPICLWM